MVRRPSKTSFLATSSLVVLAGLIAWLMLDTREPGIETQTTLRLYCAAGLKNPVLDVVADYEREYSVRVEVDHGGSGALLSRIEVARRGDLYLAGDETYVETAIARGLARERFDVATLTPVLAVRAGNPKAIHALADLSRADVRVGLADDRAAAVGRCATELLERAGLGDRVHPIVSTGTVPELANALVLDAIDVAIVWDATVAAYDALQAIAIPVEPADVRAVTLSVLTSSEDPRAALQFARYLTARDRGARRFEERGFQAVQGDVWSERPTVTLMAGAMLNPAIDAFVSAFEEREGCRVDRIYNGCGILVAQMQRGAPVDAYFSCDQSFFDLVATRFDERQTISANEIVLLVRQGNPQRIATLEDLVTRELRLGMCRPDKSALGALTKRLLERQGLWERLERSANVVVQSDTAHVLVNQMRAGSLDAAIVYRSSCAYVLERLTVVPIAGDFARAEQPLGIALASDHRQLLERLRAWLTSEEARRRFESLGFSWKLPPGK
ncbi:MAG: molybdate ABC transporter substrate-binding protein [Planctomycetes bacterium]|nr:molybdate ABC transporter substrate-binding protein [Planctomycetota bacterium]MCB9891737.1 molybdate ABC transporter substrate-binding protein [Planctomycetota bacterium]